MATREAKRAREVAATQRIDAAVHLLAERLEIEMPEPAMPAKDPELRNIQAWEWLAMALEQVVSALNAAQKGEAGTPASPRSPGNPVRGKARGQA